MDNSKFINSRHPVIELSIQSGKCEQKGRIYMFKRQHSGERAQTHARLNMFRTHVKHTRGKAKIEGYYFVAYPSQNGNKPKVYAYRSSQRALDSKIVKKCDRKKGKILEYLSVDDMKDEPSIEVEDHKQACIRTVAEQAFVDLHDIRESYDC